MSTHDVSACQHADGWTARCTCGWVGRTFAGANPAVRERGEHLEHTCHGFEPADGKTAPSELELRLADIAELVISLPTDGDGNLMPAGNSAHLLSAIDHALRGDPGCLDADEHQAMRQRAWEANRALLGL